VAAGLAAIAMVAALVVFAGPQIALPGPARCGPPSGPLAFCATLPPFRSADALPQRLVDQARPCEDPAALIASFCLSLPAATGTTDPAVLVASRQNACAQLAPSDAPAFCLAPPSGAIPTIALQRQVALALLRQRLGNTFRRTASGAVDLWTETTTPTAISDAVFPALVQDAAADEAFFGRAFADPPAVLLFTSRQSFAAALERQFGFSPETAAVLARQSGGVTLAGIDAIAINGENLLTAGRPTIFRHELAHVAIHRLAGDAIPAWLDEGLATLAEERDALGVDRATALSILRNEPGALAIFADDRSWLDRNNDLGGHAYGVAAEAARVLDARLGRAGTVALLERIGAGTPAATAIEDALGETLSRFAVQLPGRALGGCREGIFTSAERTDGLRIWSAYGFRPRTSVAVDVDGPSHYAFRVVTDRYGVYTATLGTPMPGGRYVLKVTADDGETAQLPIALADATAVAEQGCGA